MGIYSLNEYELPTDAYDITFTKCLNDYGSASFKVLRSIRERGKCYNEDGKLLCKIGSVFKCRDVHGNLVYEFIYKKESWVIKDGYYEITYSGPGIISILDHAKLWPDPTLSRLDTTGDEYKFQYPVDTNNPNANLHKINMDRYTSNNPDLTVQGVYIKTYDKIVNGEYVKTDPRLVGKTIKSIIDNYTTETAFRGANKVDIELSSGVDGDGDIGDYKKECGTSYSDIIKNDLVNQLGLFIRDEYEKVDGVENAKLKLYNPIEIIKSVNIVSDDRIFNISGEYSSDENYQEYLTISNDIMVSCRDISKGGKEGILPIADFIEPDSHVAYASQFTNRNNGSFAFCILIDGTGLEPFKDFDVGDLLTVSIPTNTGNLQIASENRVLSIMYTYSDEYTVATIELNDNDKANSIINLPKILREEQQNRESALKARMPSTADITSINTSTDGKIMNVSLSNGTTSNVVIGKDKITIDGKDIMLGAIQ